jgi:hypothetical protein
MADVVRGLDDHFPRDTFSIAQLFLDERRRVVTAALAAVIDKHEATIRHVWEETRTLAHYLREADAPIPVTLAMVARHVLEQEALAVLDDAAELGVLPDRMFELAAEAATFNLALDLAPARATMHRAMVAALDRVAERLTEAEVARAVALVEGTERLRLRYKRWSTQNRFFELWQAKPDARPVLAPLARALGFALPGEAVQ